jgi:hypothetical protein
MGAALKGLLGGVSLTSRRLVPAPEKEVMPVARLLVEAGADVHRAGPLGTPLMEAARHGHRAVAEFLIESGADPKATFNGQSASDYARMYRKLELAEWLDSLPGKTTAPPPSPPAPPPPPTRRPKMAKAPPLARAARKQEFEAALADLAGRCEGKPVPLGDVGGAFRLHVPVRKREEIDVVALQAEFLSRGCFVFEPSYSRNGPESLAVIPVAEYQKAIAVMGTHAPNYDLGSADIIAWLEELEKEAPFVLTTIAHDTLGGRFLRPIDDPAALAVRMYEFCPDLVDQGCETVEALAAELRKSQDLFFWWD